MAEEIYKSFEKGLNTEYPALRQPSGTYISALNMVRRRDGTPFNESGTSLLTNLPVGLVPIGGIVMEEEIALFLTDNINSEIGVIKSNDEYTTIINNPILNFNRSSQIDVQWKKNFKGDRVLYFTDDGRNPPRVINLDDVDVDDLNIFLSYNLPQVTLDTINEDGNLNTGIYSFSVRLLTGTTNNTAFSVPSGLVPIVDDIKVVGRDNYDGALPQTPSTKSIRLNITNVDPNFDFIEIAVITYNGLANNLEANIIGRLPIEGRTTIPFTYRTDNQKIEQISLSDIVQEYPFYNGAKCIEQKDGIMFLSNLTSESLDLGFQAVANAITLKYKIKSVAVPVENIIIKFRDGQGVDSDEGIDLGTNTATYEDYKNESLTFDSKSYMRDEVYSFAIVPVFTTGQIGAAYHIPGNNRSTSTTIEADPNTFLLGTYVSNSDYPSGYSYPTGKVRHHKMPSLSQEPHYIRDGANYFIRILGIEVEGFEDALTLLGEDATRIQGYYLVRQIRTDDNKSIITQGIAQNLYTSEDTAGPYTHFYLSPSTGKPGWIGDGSFTPDSTTITPGR